MNTTEQKPTRRGLTDKQKEFVTKSSGVFGCYLLYDNTGKRYVGKSFDIGQRLMTHFCGAYKDFMGSIVVFDLTKIVSEMNHAEASEYLSYYERMLIRKFSPSDNIKMKKNAVSWASFCNLTPKVQSVIMKEVEDRSSATSGRPRE